MAALLYVLVLTLRARLLSEHATQLCLLLVCIGGQGLFGRSFVVPNETHGADGLWVNSTAPGFEGWQWKADASSDELCGHLFAFTTVATFMNGSAGPGGAGSAQESAQYLVDIADYITSNGFYLIGEYLLS
jgi:hypothetical protein